MAIEFGIRKPFFELGPKVYLFGDDALELALHADGLAEKFSVDIIFTAQYTDIEKIADKTRNLKVFAQHMDSNPIGRGVGAVLAEALKYAGAQGVLLNHSERPMALAELNSAIRRADQAGLATLVCAGTIEESMAVACLRPNLVLAESPALIGAGKRSENDREEIQRINTAIRSIQEDLLILHGAGISNASDVYQIILAGADGTGSTSGVLQAPDPKQMLSDMIEAVQAAYQERTNKKQEEN
jgi:Triosephosphate isomerase